jgi:hypothetical protein
MEPPMTATLAFPGQTIRIGVTGTRNRADADRPHVREQVTALLGRIAGTRGPDCTALRLRLLSPLAEGADRLVADCAHALKKDYELICPLPFKLPAYEDDLRATPGSLAEFHTLLERAAGRILALDGARDDPEQGLYAQDRCYEAAGLAGAGERAGSGGDADAGASGGLGAAVPGKGAGCVGSATV